MYKFIAILCVCFLFSCKEEATQPFEDLLSQMSALNAQIEGLIETSCSTSGQCMATPYGAKPCGGPLKYLVHTTDIDLIKLYALVSQYNSLNEQYNQESGIGSDCALVGKPEVECLSGNCQAVGSPD